MKHNHIHQHNKQLKTILDLFFYTLHAQEYGGRNKQRAKDFKQDFYQEYILFQAGM